MNIEDEVVYEKGNSLRMKIQIFASLIFSTAAVHIEVQERRFPMKSK